MTSSEEQDRDPADLLPPAGRAKFETLPPFVQDAVRRGARLQPALSEGVWASLESAAAGEDWIGASLVVQRLAPKLPPEVILEALLFFHAIAEQNERAEIIRSLLDLYAAYVQRVKEDVPDESNDRDPT